jgi:LacI family transcriptional regulator
MTHRFPLKEIARQAGLGTATVDRALNNRAYVSPQSKARVAAAIAELEGQETLLAARGRRMFFDFVIEAPQRFSREIRRAAELVMPQIATVVCRSRFVIQQQMEDSETVAALDRICKRGSQGVCVKLRDTPVIQAAVQRLCDADIPVVSLVTDISNTGRIAYIGLDNHGAGQIAAYLTATAVGDVAGSVLATRSNDQFLGEEARETAFKETLAQLCPRLRVVPLSGGLGRGLQTAQLIEGAKADLGDCCGVYSMGGGNRAIRTALNDASLSPKIFIAHDLDRDNRALIQNRQLDFIMHHDLKSDLLGVFQTFLGHHKLAHQQPETVLSDIQVITPFNVPSQTV